jgi:hydroxymethylbilane synthase
MVGQGCVAVEVRIDNADARRFVGELDHAPTRRALETERAFLSTLGAGCTAPVAAHVAADDSVRAFMANDSTSVQIVGSLDATEDYLSVGAELARECRRQLGESSYP